MLECPKIKDKQWNVYRRPEGIITALAIDQRGRTEENDWFSFRMEATKENRLSGLKP